MKLEALAMALPEVAGHPNRLPFEGVLTRVDEASNKPPSGARGHRVILSRAAAQAALPSLMGMAVDFARGWDGHDARRKCGIITQADLDGNCLRVSGYLYGKDFPEVEERMRRSTPGTMGMSYEIADAHVEDLSAEVWTLSRATFTGAAILLREKAAYRNTSFQLVARRCRESVTRRAPLAERSRPLDGRNTGELEKGRQARWN
jgi:hypothetical protein